MTKEQLAEEKYPIVESTGSSHWTRMDINEKERVAFIAGFEAAEPKWISVDDELPEFNEDVLVLGYPKYPTMDGKMIIGIQRRTPYEHLSKNNSIRNIVGIFSGFRTNVKFWMPLPKISAND